MSKYIRVTQEDLDKGLEHLQGLKLRFKNKKIRVLCIDRKGDYPITFLEDFGDREETNGINYGRFLESVTKKQSVKVRWVNYLKGENFSKPYASKEEAKKQGKENGYYIKTIKVKI